MDIPATQAKTTTAESRHIPDKLEKRSECHKIYRVTLIDSTRDITDML